MRRLVVGGGGGGDRKKKGCAPPPPPPPPPPQLAETESEEVRRELERWTIDESGEAVVPKKKMITASKNNKMKKLVCYNNECFSEDLLRKVFDAMVGASGGINKEQFVHLCGTLKLGLSEVETGRVWNQLWVDSGYISFDQFVWAIQRRRLLRRIVSAYLTQDTLEEEWFRVESDYDYSLPTCVAYASSRRRDEERQEVEGSSIYAAQRKLVDYEYHPLYVERRRSWQDEVIRRVAVRSDAQSSPWLVYTCGAMGAGKGYALHWLSEHGYFPLEDIVHIDPDRFKEMMPEWPGYVSRDRDSAGSLTHRESGYLAEITQEVAMERRQHVWVDGSLRNADYFTTVFQELRLRHPAYRIAIFYVDARPEVAWRRTRTRAAKTGRAVPKDLFHKSMAATAESLRVLTPYVDFLARIENQEDAQPPRLAAFETVDSSGDMSVIRRCFADSEPEAEFANFPQRRGPLRLRRCFDTATHYEPRARTLEDECLAKPFATAQIADQRFTMASAPHILNWGSAVRRRADVPPSAVFFAFCDPLDDRADDDRADEARQQLEANGGLFYLDLQHTILRVMAFCANDKSTRLMLRFNPPEPLPQAAAAVLRHRWRLLPEGHLARSTSATHHCWIAPCENLGGARYAPYGGQVFYFAADHTMPGGSSGNLLSPRSSTLLLYPLYSTTED
ncbi:hypothetical protein CTAYLR_001107 [Chrysophaeum taylorii]|uniref:Zeta toxin domain-containing protein n=1 Tax=Chrysophaeum taylorii TaxID=2483200 RepID=A0AAD7UPT7_9STRA|nr:hypothetical protein CTAYLR_001107 [Chrysophaeum taylorii]